MKPDDNAIDKLDHATAQHVLSMASTLLESMILQNGMFYESLGRTVKHIEVDISGCHGEQVAALAAHVSSELEPSWDMLDSITMALYSGGRTPGLDDIIHDILEAGSGLVLSKIRTILDTSEESFPIELEGMTEDEITIALHGIMFAITRMHRVARIKDYSETETVYDNSALSVFLWCMQHDQLGEALEKLVPIVQGVDEAFNLRFRERDENRLRIHVTLALHQALAADVVQGIPWAWAYHIVLQQCVENLGNVELWGKATAMEALYHQQS